MSLWIREDLRASFGALAFEDIARLGEHVVRVGPDGARSTAWFERGGRRFFLKVHTGVGWREIIKCWLQGKRPILDAMPEARALERLAALKVPAPRLVGFGRMGLNPARRRSFVLSESLDDTEDLEDFLRRELPLRPPLRRAVAHALGHQVGRLHAARIAHQDLYLTHFRIRFDADGSFRLFLIDLHRARTRRTRSGRWRAKDLAALWFSGMGLALGPRDRLRFLKSYRAHAHWPDGRAAGRRLLGVIERRARVIHRRVERRGPAGRSS